MHVFMHACTCMHCFECVCVFSTRCLPLTSALHGEWNFPLFVNTWSACLLAVYVQRMYVRDVCDVTNGRCCHNIKICNINKKLSFPTVPAWNIQPDDKQQQSMETQQKPIQQTNRLQFQFALFLIRQIFLISTAVGNLASPLPKVIRVEVFFISCMYVCMYMCLFLLLDNRTRGKQCDGSAHWIREQSEEIREEAIKTECLPRNNCNYIQTY